MKLLLADDEPLALKMLESAVRQALPEAEIYSFKNAREAIGFARYNKIKIAFLDINMPVITGLEMAKQLTEIQDDINIVFCTGYEKYAVDAFKIYAAGYLMKPITAKDVLEVTEHLRFPLNEKKHLRFQCFGNFDAFYDEKPIKFSLSRTKELLAYLVDRKGATASSSEITAILFEDDNNIYYYHKLRADLIKTFSELGLSDCIVVHRGGLAINRKLVECDYYDYLEGKQTEKPIEYMSQYSFAEETLALLLDEF